MSKGNRGWDGRIKTFAALKTMKPVSMRHRILDLHRKGIGPSRIAGLVCCSLRTVHNYLEQARETGVTVAPLPVVIGVES